MIEPEGLRAAARARRRGTGYRLIVTPVIAAAGLAAAVACADDVPHPPGHVVGLARPCVGVQRGPLPRVTVIVEQAGRVVASQRVNGSQHYRIGLREGNYIVKAPVSSLPARHVFVIDGRDVTVNFTPSCK